MEKILLVEPNYQNKYPPIGLMKIASYHRRKGDIVEFYKGEAPYTKISQMDRVYITTLFTFHYDITKKCILHYAKYINKDSIYVGGIAATLLTKDYQHDTGIQNIIRGQLVDSSILGYNDRINIDKLPLDYDILDDVPYVYPAGDNYFVYTTRGCPRGCSFCAVKDLEPEYITTNNIIEQVERVDTIYGQKRNLLVMDNNILCSPELENIIQDIKSLGFNGEASFIKPNPFTLMMNKVKRRIIYRINYSKQIDEIMEFLAGFAKRIERYKKAYNHYREIISCIDNEEEKWPVLLAHEKEITDIIEKYRPKTRMIRYVDFNQGIDARLINDHNIKILSSIPIKPFRLAYDNIEDTDIFIKATKTAIKHKIKDFSNYILYNWEDKPQDLWIRLNNAIKVYNNTGKISAFSFPMKYAPVDEKDRSYVGKYWNKKYLSAISIILNVTKGIVAKEIDFFYEAFGSNVDEFLIILNMPDEFIRFRRFFKNNKLIECWRNLYLGLSEEEKEYLLKVLCEAKLDRSVIYKKHPASIKRILLLYTINKSQFDRGEKKALLILKQIKEMEELV